ncbi:MAG: proprotein convertase P-domain-containing protein, partial [Limisphaerales bacterium]
MNSPNLSAWATSSGNRSFDITFVKNDGSKEAAISVSVAHPDSDGTDFANWVTNLNNAFMTAGIHSRLSAAVDSGRLVLNKLDATVKAVEISFDTNTNASVFGFYVNQSSLAAKEAFASQVNVATSAAVKIKETGAGRLVIANGGNIIGDAALTDDLIVGAGSEVSVILGAPNIALAHTANANLATWRDASYTVTGTLTAVSAGDFSGDGKSDLAALVTPANGAGGSVYIQNGSASLPAGPTALSVTWSYTETIQSARVFSPGDLDGDGKDDLVITGTAGALIAKGDTWTTRLHVGEKISFFSVGNLNKSATDTHADLGAVAIESSPKLTLTGEQLGHPVARVYYGGSNFFSALPSPSLVFELSSPLYADLSSFSTVPTALARGVGDVNGDGRNDLVVSEFTQPVAHLYYGSESGGFEDLSVPVVPLTARPHVFALTTPGLSVPDSALHTGIDISGAGETQSAGGAVAIEGDSLNERLSEVISVGDFSGDGHDDFILLSKTTAYLFLGPVELSGLGEITPLADFLFSMSELGNPSRQAGDINGDGIHDLAFIKESGGDLVVTLVLGGPAHELPRQVGINGLDPFYAKQIEFSGARQLANPSSANVLLTEYSANTNPANKLGRSDLVVTVDTANTAGVFGYILQFSDIGNFGKGTGPGGMIKDVAPATSIPLHLYTSVESATGLTISAGGHTLNDTTAANFSAPNTADGSSFGYPTAGLITTSMTDTPAGGIAFGFSPSTFTRSLTFSGLQGVISDVDVTLNIDHVYDWDVNVVLKAPNGTTVQLLSYNGSSRDNFTNTKLDDEAATSIYSGTAPFTGSFRPVSSLSVLDGLSGNDINGTWELVVTDVYPSADHGVFKDWTLDITTIVPVTNTATLSTGTGTVTDVNVQVIFDDNGAAWGESELSNLELTLIAPNQTRVPLKVKGTTFAGNNHTGAQTLVFDDEGTNSGLSWKPAQSLGLFEGLLASSLAGDWKLEVTNHSGSPATVQITDWKVDVRTTSPLEKTVTVPSTTGEEVSALVARITTPSSYPSAYLTGLLLQLESPNGASVPLLYKSQSPVTGGIESSWEPVDNRLLGTQPSGNWKLSIVDPLGRATGTVSEWELNVRTRTAFLVQMPEAGGTQTFGQLTLTFTPGITSLTGINITIEHEDETHAVTGTLSGNVATYSLAQFNDKSTGGLWRINVSGDASAAGSHSVTDYRLETRTTPVGLKVTAAGDVDGDGRQDLLFTNSGFKDASGQVLSGNEGTAWLLGGGTGAKAGSSAPRLTNHASGAWKGLFLDESYALGDLNQDGYADFALSRSREDSTAVGALLIYLGGTQYNQTTDDVTLQDATTAAGVRVSHAQPGGLTGTAYEGQLEATAGDFNQDGKWDLVISEPSFVQKSTLFGGGELQVNSDERGAVYLFFSLTDKGNSLILGNDSDLRINGAGVRDLFGRLPSTPGIDLNGDGLHDLAAGSPDASAFLGSVAAQAGQVSVFYGNYPSSELPALFDILTNRSVTGSGSFLVNLGTGRPFIFVDSDLNGDSLPDTDNYMLSAGTSERWYRFTLLGDGQAGQYIRLEPAAVSATSARLSGVAGVGTSSSVTVAGDTLVIDATGEYGIMEFDLAAFLPQVEDPESLEKVLLHLRSAAFVEKTIPAVKSLIGTDTGRVFFTAQNSAGRWELWASEGTFANTNIVQTFSAEPTLLSASPGGRLVFQVGVEIQTTNGTTPQSRGFESYDKAIEVNGEVYVTKKNTGELGQMITAEFTAVTTSGGDAIKGVTGLHEANGVLYAVGKIGSGTDLNLLRISGRTAELMLLGSGSSGNVIQMLGATQNVKNFIYYIIDQGSGDTLLLRANLTDGGLDVLSEWNNLNSLTLSGGNVYFVGDEGSNSRVLGYATATQVDKVSQGANSLTNTSVVTTDGTRLYVTAGMDSNLRSVVGAVSSNVLSSSNQLRTVGETVIFNRHLLVAASAGTSGDVELFALDAGGQVRNAYTINSSGSSSPSFFAVLGDVAYFVADAGSGRKIHQIAKNGTGLAATTTLTDFQGAAINNPTGLTAVGSALYFSADASEASGGLELFRFSPDTQLPSAVLNAAATAAQEGIFTVTVPNGSFTLTTKTKTKDYNNLTVNIIDTGNALDADKNTNGSRVSFNTTTHVLTIDVRNGATTLGNVVTWIDADTDTKDLFDASVTAGDSAKTIFTAPQSLSGGDRTKIVHTYATGKTVTFTAAADGTTLDDVALVLIDSSVTITGGASASYSAADKLISVFINSGTTTIGQIQSKLEGLTVIATGSTLTGGGAATDVVTLANANTAVTSGNGAPAKSTVTLGTLALSGISLSFESETNTADHNGGTIEIKEKAGSGITITHSDTPSHQLVIELPNSGTTTIQELVDAVNASTMSPFDIVDVPAGLNSAVITVTGGTTTLASGKVNMDGKADSMGAKATATISGLGVSVALTLESETNTDQYNGTTINIEDGNVSSTTISYSNPTLDITLNQSGTTTLSSLISSINSSMDSPFQVTTTVTTELGALNVDVQAPRSTLATGTSDNSGTDGKARATLTVDGVNFKFTANAANTAASEGIRIKVVDTTAITDTTAKASYGSTHKVLLILVNDGVTTATAIKNALEAGATSALDDAELTLASVTGTTGLDLASDDDTADNAAAKKAKVTFAPSGDSANLTIEAVTAGTAGNSYQVVFRDAGDGTKTGVWSGNTLTLTIDSHSTTRTELIGLIDNATSALATVTSGTGTSNNVHDTTLVVTQAGVDNTLPEVLVTAPGMDNDLIFRAKTAPTSSTSWNIVYQQGASLDVNYAGGTNTLTVKLTPTTTAAQIRTAVNAEMSSPLNVHFSTGDATNTSAPDGSGTFAFKLKEFAISGSTGYMPTQMRELSGNLFFVGNGKLYRQSGAAAPTEVSGPAGNFGQLTVLGTNLYLVATDSSDDTQLYKVAADGTASSVRDLNLTQAKLAEARLTVFGSDLYFVDEENGMKQAFKYNGTAVSSLSELASLSAVVGPQDLVEFSNRLTFTLNNNKIYQTPTDSSVVVAQVGTGTVLSSLSHFVVGGTSLYFSGGTNGQTLYKLTGSSISTVKMHGNASNDGVAVHGAFANSTFYYTVQLASGGFEIHKDGGTTAITAATHAITDLTATDHWLFYNVSNSSGLKHLWRTNDNESQVNDSSGNQITNATNLVGNGSLLTFLNASKEFWRVDASTGSNFDAVPMASL